MFARGRMCVYGRYAPELCSFFLFSWSWLIPRVSRDFIDCDEFKWQRLLLDLFNRFVRTAMTKHYRQYRCSQRWCSIDIKTICLSFFFFRVFHTRGGHRLLCQLYVKPCPVPVPRPHYFGRPKRSNASPKWIDLLWFVYLFVCLFVFFFLY